MEKDLLAADLGTIEGIGRLGFQGGRSPFEAFELLNTIISLTIAVMTISAGIWFIFQFFAGAFAWLTSGGDKAKVEEARNRITHAVIGLAIVVLAIFLISVIGNFFGLDILNPGSAAGSLWGGGANP